MIFLLSLLKSFNMKNDLPLFMVRSVSSSGAKKGALLYTARSSNSLTTLNSRLFIMYRYNEYPNQTPTDIFECKTTRLYINYKTK